MPQSADQFSGIFICYRRDDSGGYARALYERLSIHFGDEQIFMDLDYIEPGEDFVQVIEKAVGSCEILLALVGRGWLTSRDETGRRLDNPNDFVRVEIASAFARDVRVIPVLVQGAQAPGEQDLPEPLKPLSRRQAFDLSDQRWRQDVDRLVGMLDRQLAKQREARRIAAEEAERRRREAEAQRQAEENERLKQAAAEAERRKREAEEAERDKRDAEERERFASQQAARAVPESIEPTNETSVAHEPLAVETLPAPEPPSSSDDGQAAPSVTAPPIGRGRRVELVGVIACVVIFAAIWGLTRWGKAGAPVTANRNATPSDTPRAEWEETPSPTIEPPQPPADMAYVPGGEFMIGRDDGDEYERPAHEVSVGPFFIDKYEVTNDAYAAFVKETRRRPPRTWKGGAYLESAARRPVTGVTWDDADAYARWAGKRLPTEEEWEFAARGADGRRYPWGDDWQSGLANAEGASGGTTDVGAYGGVSPFGAFDMVGNAWEWTASPLKSYPQEGRGPSNPAIDAAAAREKMRVIRGCMYECSKDHATTTYRRGWPANSSRVAYDKTGFRCAKDVTK